MISHLSLGPAMTPSNWPDTKESSIIELSEWYPFVGGKERLASTAVGQKKGFICPQLFK